MNFHSVPLITKLNYEVGVKIITLSLIMPVCNSAKLNISKRCTSVVLIPELCNAIELTKE
jgi:hypothetical protein